MADPDDDDPLVATAGNLVRWAHSHNSVNNGNSAKSSSHGSAGDAACSCGATHSHNGSEHEIPAWAHPLGLNILVRSLVNLAVTADQY